MDILFNNYGLRWHADRVAWSTAAGKVGLLGVPGRNRKSAPVDFRDQVAIYVLYRDEEVVYVGQSGSRENRLLSRLKNHRADRLADRWDGFSWFGLLGVSPDGTLAKKSEDMAIHPAQVLDQIEAVMVEAVEPRLNRQGGQFGESVTRYIQYPGIRDEQLKLNVRD